MGQEMKLLSTTIGGVSLVEINLFQDLRLYSESDMKNNLGSARIDDSSFNKGYLLKNLLKVSDLSRPVLKGE